MGHIHFEPIETERLLLRRFQLSDADEFLKYRTDPEIALYQSEGWLDYTPEKAVDFVTSQMKHEPGIPGSWFQVAIALKETGELIGDCAIHTLPEDERQAEIGFTIKLSRQRKGYATEAVKAQLNYLFKNMNIHRVIAVVDVRNNSSIGLLERLGMRREGHFLRSYWYKDGYTDEYLYAILNEEWI